MNPISTQSAKFWQNKRVLITGHTGFKGSWLSLWLNSLGAKVAGYSLEPATEPSLFSLAKIGRNVETVYGDVRDLASVESIFKKFKPEIVIHMAAQALVRPSYRDPVDTYATNVMGTVHVLDVARKTDSIRAVVNVTSDKCYENREWPWGYRENEAMGGYDPYSSSKGCSELVTSAYRRSFFQDASGKMKAGLASGRAGNVIGGGDWAVDRLIPDCIRALTQGKPVPIRSPKSIRPWQHVLEPLAGYMLLAEKVWENPVEYSQGWNFGPEAMGAKTVDWIADRMVKIWGNGARWDNLSPVDAPHEAQHLKLDCSLANSKLDWHPRLSLEQTLEWVITWYRRCHEGEPAAELTLQQIREYERL